MTLRNLKYKRGVVATEIFTKTVRNIVNIKIGQSSLIALAVLKKHQGQFEYNFMSWHHLHPINLF